MKHRFMYFPKNILAQPEIVEILNLISHMSNLSFSEKMRKIDMAIDKALEDKDIANSPLFEMLRDYKLTLYDAEWIEHRHRKELYKHEEEKRELEKEKMRLMDELARMSGEMQNKVNMLSLVSSDLKSYKDIYIFLLSHPKNNSSATVEILSRINYLNTMTRDVVFVMPGYQKATESDLVVDIADPQMKLTFNENLFMEIVQQIEDKSDSKFTYEDKCELLIVGASRGENYDFNNFARLDLNLLAKKREINPTQLILKLAHHFRACKENINIKKSVNQILGEMTMEEYKPTYRVFIAGSKVMKNERAMLREELSKIENSLNIDIRAFTFEDFASSLTGSDTFRQDQYNEFIKNEADVTVFIFDTEVGDITLKEFEVAYESLQQSRRPEIFVYANKQMLSLGQSNPKLQQIHEKVFGPNKEYYVEYGDEGELRYLFYSNMINYFQGKCKQ